MRRDWTNRIRLCERVQALVATFQRLLQPVGGRGQEYMHAPADHDTSKAQRSCPRPHSVLVGELGSAVRLLGHQPTHCTSRYSELLSVS